MRILQPEFPEPLYPADFSAAVSEYRDTEERIEQKIFKNFRAENERFGHAEFFGCVFENCKFNDCAFERFEYTNACLLYTSLHGIGIASPERQMAGGVFIKQGVIE